MLIDESRTVKFLTNSASMFIYQAILMISGFITPRIMLSYYGSQINGLVSSVAQFVGYISLVEAGLSATTVYSLYKPLSDQDHSAISSVVTAAKQFYYKSGYLFLLLITLLAIVYPFFIEVPDGMNYMEVLLLVLITSVSGIIDLFSLAKYRALLTADQKTYILSIGSIIYVIANISIIALLASFRVNICIVKAVALLAVFIRTIFLVVYCQRKYPYVNYYATPDNSALSKRWDALFQQVLGVIQNGSPIVIITVVCRDLSLVSIFAIFNMVTAALNSLLSIFISGLAASFGELIAKDEMETLKKAYCEFETIYYMLLGIVYSVAFVMIMPFIDIYTSGISDANYYQPLLGFLFVLNGLLYNLKTPQGMLVLSSGLYKETRNQTLIQALLIIAVGVPLAFIWNVIGVMAGLLVSNIYRNVDLLFFIPSKVTGLPLWLTVKKWLTILVNVIAMYAVFVVVRFEVTNYIEWAILAAITSAITLVITFTTFLITCHRDILSLYARVRKIF